MPIGNLFFMTPEEEAAAAAEARRRESEQRGFDPSFVPGPSYAPVTPSESRINPRDLQARQDVAMGQFFGVSPRQPAAFPGQPEDIEDDALKLSPLYWMQRERELEEQYGQEEGGRRYLEEASRYQTAEEERQRQLAERATSFPIRPISGPLELFGKAMDPLMDIPVIGPALRGTGEVFGAGMETFFGGPVGGLLFPRGSREAEQAAEEQSILKNIPVIGGALAQAQARWSARGERIPETKAATEIVSSFAVPGPPVGKLVRTGAKTSIAERFYTPTSRVIREGELVDQAMLEIGNAVRPTGEAMTAQSALKTIRGIIDGDPGALAQFGTQYKGVFQTEGRAIRRALESVDRYVQKTRAAEGIEQFFERPPSLPSVTMAELARELPRLAEEAKAASIGTVPRIAEAGVRILQTPNRWTRTQVSDLFLGLTGRFTVMNTASNMFALVVSGLTRVLNPIGNARFARAWIGGGPRLIREGFGTLSDTFSGTVTVKAGSETFRTGGSFVRRVPGVRKLAEWMQENNNRIERAFRRSLYETHFRPEYQRAAYEGYRRVPDISDRFAANLASARGYTEWNRLTGGRVGRADFDTTGLHPWAQAILDEERVGLRANASRGEIQEALNRASTRLRKLGEDIADDVRAHSMPGIDELTHKALRDQVDQLRSKTRNTDIKAELETFVKQLDDEFARQRADRLFENMAESDRMQGIIRDIGSSANDARVAESAQVLDVLARARTRLNADYFMRTAVINKEAFLQMKMLLKQGRTAEAWQLMHVERRARAQAVYDQIMARQNAAGQVAIDALEKIRAKTPPDRVYGLRPTDYRTPDDALRAMGIDPEDAARTFRERGVPDEASPFIEPNVAAQMKAVYEREAEKIRTLPIQEEASRLERLTPDQIEQLARAHNESLAYANRMALHQTETNLFNYKMRTWLDAALEIPFLYPFWSTRFITAQLIRVAEKPALLPVVASIGAEWYEKTKDMPPWLLMSIKMPFEIGGAETHLRPLAWLFPLGPGIAENLQALQENGSPDALELLRMTQDLIGLGVSPWVTAAASGLAAAGLPKDIINQIERAGVDIEEPDEFLKTIFQQSQIGVNAMALSPQLRERALNILTDRDKNAITRRIGFEIDQGQLDPVLGATAMWLLSGQKESLDAVAGRLSGLLNREVTAQELRAIVDSGQAEALMLNKVDTLGARTVTQVASIFGFPISIIAPETEAQSEYYEARPKDVPVSPAEERAREQAQPGMELVQMFTRRQEGAISKRENALLREFFASYDRNNAQLGRDLTRTDTIFQTSGPSESLRKMIDDALKGNATANEAVRASDYPGAEAQNLLYQYQERLKEQGLVHAVQLFVDGYWAVAMDERWDLPNGEFDYDGRKTALDSYISQWPTDTRAEGIAEVKRKEERLKASHPAYGALLEARATLGPYWQIPEQIFVDLPLRWQNVAASYSELRQIVESGQATRTQMVAYDYINDKVSDLRERYRLRNPDADTALVEWYGYVPIKERKGGGVVPRIGPRLPRFNVP